MQNSELFRRGVVLPLNEEAEELLKINEVEETTSVRYLEIEDEKGFENLWAVGIFQKINERVNGMIDDYEEHFVEASKMSGVMAAIDDVRGANKLSNDVESFMGSLVSMASEASSIERPLLFVL